LPKVAKASAAIAITAGGFVANFYDGKDYQDF
jgi:hypothetical protein